MATFDPVRPVKMRLATSSDGDVITAMLLHAVNWHPDRPGLARDEILSTPELARYVTGWPRRGDLGVIAVDDAGIPLGASWLRRFTADEHGYGYVDDTTPELSIAVAPGWRGRGIGRSLLAALLSAAAEADVGRISLSVERGNPASRCTSRSASPRSRRPVPP